MQIATLGDVALDVIVDVPGGLHHDDDSEATITLSVGGQAANVASWVVALGGSATVIGPRGESAAAALVTERLSARGVDFAGVPVSRAPTVVSIVADGSRTMASDAGDQTWLAVAGQTPLTHVYDWLHLSSYPLLRSADPRVALPLVERVRAESTKVSIDLSSAALLTAFGTDRFRSALEELRPTVVFANESEWAALDWPGSSPPFDVVLKAGAEGIAVISAGERIRYPAQRVPVVDATGAGDALAAGYLVGGVDLALTTAARCIGIVGAQPGGHTTP